MQPKFHFCFWMQDPTGQVCFGVSWAHCAFLRIDSILLSCKIFCMHVFLALRFFSCVVVVFFCFEITKLATHCFSLFHFYNLHSVLICVVHNYLFVCVLAFLLFSIICVIPCLPYFLEWFCALFHYFFLPKCSLFRFFVFCRFFSATLARFFGLFGCAIYFFLWCRVF